MPLIDHPASNPNPSDKKSFTETKKKESLSDVAKNKSKGSVVMNTGGGDPMNRGEKWKNHPEVERVDQPHNASNGRFAFNSTVGLGKVDPRDRAKGTDPGTSEKVANIAKDEKPLEGGASGLKAGTRIYANGNYYILSADVTHDEIVKNYGIWSKYKDGHGENAFLDNGLFVRAQGTVHQEKLPQGAATEDFTVIDQKDVSEFGNQTQRRLAKASQEWEDWKKNPNVGTQVYAEPSPKNWSAVHPGQPLPTPAPTPAPAPAPTPNSNQTQPKQKDISDEDAQSQATQDPESFLSKNKEYIDYLSQSGVSGDDIINGIKNGEIKWSDLR